MRVRKRENVEQLLAEHPEIVYQTACDWSEVFQNHRPIHIEVGCGKGDFITGMALRHPEINYIGIDLQATVISYAMDKLLDLKLPNARLLLLDGSNLTDYFSKGEVELLYLNFSDPWPKNRHEKRRLTYKSFLSLYEQILQPEGQIHFKTDNRGLFEYSLASMSQYGMTFNQVWLDLHKDSDFMKENVLTEYERKFSAKGPIYRLEASFNHKIL